MWREKLSRFMEENRQPEWRYAHSFRVYHLSRELDVEGRCDDDVLFAVAMIHDIGAYPKYREEGVDHPVTSRKFAEVFLREIGFPEEKTDTALEAIEKHMFPSPVGKSPESVVVRDADILDFLGMIGVARVFLKHQDDLGPGCREIRDLSRKLPGLVTTDKAKEMAQKRKKEMESFLDVLEEECFTGKFI